MKPFFIGIAGGSGTGKTTLAKELKKYFGKKASILHMDNYQKFEEKIPKILGMKNWDHPKAIKWRELLKDLNSLKKNRTIRIESRDQERLDKLKIITFVPSEIIIVEGYLLFLKSRVRKLLDSLIYLEADEKTRVKRRSKIKGKDRKYIKKVVLPMHKKYIEPTKKYANLVLKTDKYSIRECSRQIIKSLPI